MWDAYFRDKQGDKVEISGGQTEIVEDSTVKTTEVEEVVEKPKTIQYDGDDPNDLEELSGVVTYAGVTGDNLMIRVNIDQYLEGGTCELNLMRGGDIMHSETAEIVGNVTTSTCEGFDIPVNEVGSGNVEIIIHLKSGNKNGVINGGIGI